MNKDNIQHVFPNDDIQEHLLQTSEMKDIVNGDIVSVLICNCKCNPIIEYAPYFSGAIVIHSSFDGREAMEETLEILGKQN